MCKNTAELLQEEKTKKVNVPETYVGFCQLSMMDLFAKIAKDFQSFTISEKTFSSHRIFDRVLNKPLYTFSNSLILENCFILSFSIMMCPFHMRARSWNIYIIDPSEEKHLCKHFPISVSFSSVISLLLLQDLDNWRRQI